MKDRAKIKRRRERRREIGVRRKKRTRLSRKGRR
jgi:hypothetical protein